jgi:Domain of unknown function (DUF6378)
MDATDFLKLANEAINDRGQEYAKGREQSMGKIVAIFNICEGLELAEAQGWRFMQILKLVRSASAPEFHQDSVIDRIAYGALEAECESRNEPIKVDNNRIKSLIDERLRSTGVGFVEDSTKSESANTKMRSVDAGNGKFKIEYYADLD